MTDDHLTELAFVANLEKSTPGHDSVLISNRVLQGSVANLEHLRSELTEARERLATATTFTLQRRGQYEGEPTETITVEWRADDKWAVLSGGAIVLNTDGEWEYEPLPTSRDDDFRSRTRFPLDEAFARARALLTKGDQNDG